MSPDQIKLIVIAAIAAALVAGGFGAGWLVNGWRLAGEIERLGGIVDTQKQSIATFEGANKRCVAGLDEVTRSVKEFVEAGAKRSEDAAKAMAEATKSAKSNLDAARDALARPPAPRGKECETAAAEAAAYAAKRRKP